jgi:hypothetical protein
LGFAHPEYWIASAAVLPIIILYLLRPRPRDLNLPSLMFILQKRSRDNRLTAFLRTLVRDPLLLIQISTILLLTTALLSPFYLAPATVERTVIVLDASASMQAVDVPPSRFDAAVEIAKNYAAGRVSIVLAENTPIVALRDGDKTEALRLLEKLMPRATKTNLGDALLLASELAGEGGRVVLISDFASNTGTSLKAAEKIAQQHTQLIYRQVLGEGENLAITGAEVRDNSLKALVKNYQRETREVSLKISSRDGVGEIKLTIPPEGIGFFTVPQLSEGVTEITLPADALEVDNRLHISIPQRRTRRVLIASDDDADNPVYLALTSLPEVSVEQIFFETMPRRFNYDLVILNNFTQNSPLPGTFEDLRKYVESGGSLAILFSEDLPVMNTHSLLPVKPAGTVHINSHLLPATSAPPVDDIDFGSIHTYLKAAPLENAVTLVESEDGTPIIAYQKVGEGYSIFIGVNENTGDFHLQPDYPIFWLKLLDWVSGREDAGAYNYRTGATVYLSEEQRVKTPTRTLTTKTLLLDEAGIYQFDGKKIAANLLDEEESNITAAPLIQQTPAPREQGVEHRQKDLSWLAIILAILMLLLEIRMLSGRGEV